MEELGPVVAPVAFGLEAGPAGLRGHGKLDEIRGVDAPDAAASTWPADGRRGRPAVDGDSTRPRFGFPRRTAA